MSAPALEAEQNASGRQLARRASMIFTGFSIN
jgi:hypothetical protein